MTRVTSDAAAGRTAAPTAAANAATSGKRSAGSMARPRRTASASVGPTSGSSGGPAACASATANGGRAVERRASGQPLAGDRGEAVLVARRRRRLPTELLWRHVAQRPHDEPVPGHLGCRSVDRVLSVLPGDAEVREQGAPIGREDDVGGLHIAVDNAGRMRRHERCRDIAHHRDRFSDRQDPVLGEMVCERRPRHVVEHERSLVVRQVAVSNTDDVRAVERLEGP